MPDWKFALEQMTDAVRQMRQSQQRLKTNATSAKLNECRAIELRVDELVASAVEFLAHENVPPVPPLIPDPIDLPPVPLPVPLVEVEKHPVPILLDQSFGFPAIPPQEIPPLPPTPAPEVEQKRGRKRGGQHEGG